MEKKHSFTTGPRQVTKRSQKWSQRSASSPAPCYEELLHGESLWDLRIRVLYLWHKFTHTQIPSVSLTYSRVCNSFCYYKSTLQQQKHTVHKKCSCLRDKKTRGCNVNVGSPFSKPLFQSHCYDFVSIYNGYIHAQNETANSETFHMYSKKYIYTHTMAVHVYRRTNLGTCTLFPPFLLLRATAH